MLYRSTDCRCRCGAAMENLAHSASFHSREKTAPSNPGIKHLGLGFGSLRTAKRTLAGYEAMAMIRKGPMT